MRKKKAPTSGAPNYILNMPLNDKFIPPPRVKLSITVKTNLLQTAQTEIEGGHQDDYKERQLYGVRRQSEAATPLWIKLKMRAARAANESTKAASPLRSAAALQKAE
jgi:hypothetical protein